MKKFFIPFICLAGMASADNYYVASSNPGAYIDYDVQPSYGLEALYGISNHNDAPDMWGFRGSMSLYNKMQANNLHNFNINVAYMSGDDDGLEVQTLPITLGYDLNIALNDNLFAFLGGKAGISYGRAEIERESDDDWGPVFSVGLGLKYKFTDVVMGKIGYEYGRSYYELNDDDSSNILSQHIISVGITVSF